MRLENEFASVEVELDLAANGPRLKILDLRTGHVGYLDPFELETLAWLDKDTLTAFFDPSRTRWKSIEPGDLDGLVP
jgi:hypothetical protein